MNERLKKIIDLIPNGAFSLDIGCDHALLDIALVKEKKMKKVMASDNKEGPLLKAKENIAKAKCEDQITLTLADGLDAYQEGVNTVIISGMGGYSILGILKRRKDLLKKIETLILSPNNYVPFVRSSVGKLGFKIVDEYLIQDKNIIYTILKFQRGKEKLTKKDALLGPILRKRRENIFIEQLERERKGRVLLLSLLPKSFFKKRRQVQRELKWILSEQKK